MAQDAATAAAAEHDFSSERKKLISLWPFHLLFYLQIFSVVILILQCSAAHSSNSNGALDTQQLWPGNILNRSAASPRQLQACTGGKGLKYISGDALMDGTNCVGPNNQPYPKWVWKCGKLLRFLTEINFPPGNSSRGCSRSGSSDLGKDAWVRPSRRPWTRRWPNQRCCEHMPRRMGSSTVAGMVSQCHFLFGTETRAVNHNIGIKIPTKRSENDYLLKIRDPVQWY